MNQLEHRVFAAVGKNAAVSSWERLVELFRIDREAFYLLACDGAPGDAGAQLRELAELAKLVRIAICETYELVPRENGADLITYSDSSTFVPGKLIDRVAEFLRAVDGKTTGDTLGADYEGAIVSEAEVRFKFGESSSQSARNEHTENPRHVH